MVKIRKREFKERARRLKHSPKYDWIALTREYVDGPYTSIREYSQWCDIRRKDFKEDRPCLDAIYKAAKDFKWSELKARRMRAVMDNVIGGRVDKGVRDKISEIVELKLTATKAMAKILVDVANGKRPVELKGDLSDIINDLMRSLGGRTREQDMPAQGGGVNINQGVQVADSFRKEIEGADDSSIEKLEAAARKSVDEIEKLIDIEVVKDK